MTTKAKLPLVWFIGTGGTIASSGSPRTVFAAYGGGPPRSVMDNLERVPEIQEHVRTKAEQYGQLGFPSPMDSVKVARRINQIFREEPETAGVVVTHGTAIMEETAYYLNLLVKSDKPVVITGSMRPPQAMGTDADNNLFGAAILAGSPEARGKGVFLFLNDEINAARDVTKTNSYRLETFQSRELGFLGYVDSDLRVKFYRLPVKKHTYQTEFDPDKITELPWVELVVCAPGTNGRVIRWLTEQHCPGIVWAGAGAGGGPQEGMDALRDAAKEGVRVVVATRGGAGHVIRTRNHIERGFLTADNLSPYKAVALLQLGLTKTKEPAELQRMFETY